MGVAYFFLAVAAVFALWAVISPQSAWQRLSAWSYKNPEANEPSAAGYAVQRVVGVVALIAIAVITLVLVNLPEPSGDAEYQECLTRERAEQAADPTPGLLDAEDWCENLSPSP